MLETRAAGPCSASLCTCKPVGCQTSASSRSLGSLPEIVTAAEFPAQLVVEAAAHLAQPAPAQVTAEAVLVPVLVDGLQEVAVPDVLLAATACQQRRGDLQNLIHGFPGDRSRVRDRLAGAAGWAPGKSPRASF